jgi:hypothetical protein
VAGHGAVLLGRALADHDHAVDEPRGVLIAAAMWLASGAAGAQRGGDLALKRATGLDVQRLVDRFRAHPHLLVVGHSLTTALQICCGDQRLRSPSATKSRSGPFRRSLRSLGRGRDAAQARGAA